MPRVKEVDRWFAKYENPMKPVVMRMRDIILAADSRITECIKWQAPTFAYEGNLASFFPKSKQHASLMFHQGALIPGKHPKLVGTAANGRAMKLASLDEVEAARKDLEKVVVAWCDWRDAQKKPPAKPTKKKPSAVKKSSTKKRRG